MKFQLITLDPLRRVAKPVHGHPAKREELPKGKVMTVPLDSDEVLVYAYVPIVPQPVVDKATQIARRKLTVDEDGWVVEDKSLDALKAEALAELESEGQQQTEGGVEVVLGELALVLASSVYDQNAFTRLVVMLDNAEKIGEAPEVATIIEIDGTPHVLPIATLRMVIAIYGSKIQEGWNFVVEKSDKIKATKTKDELDAEKGVEE